MVTPRGCDSAKVISVIVTRALKGSGTENDPVREVIQYWDFDGNLLAEHDSVNERFWRYLHTVVRIEKGKCYGVYINCFFIDWAFFDCNINRSNITPKTGWQNAKYIYGKSE